MAARKTSPWPVDEVQTFLGLVADEKIQRELDGATRYFAQLWYDDPAYVEEALHIMAGLLNIGLGVILHSVNGPWAWQIEYMGVPYWIGAVFILFGIVSIVSEKRPSPCLVIVSVILNLAGVAFAITAIVVYSSIIADLCLGPICDDFGYRYRSRYNQPTPSPHEELMKEKCYEARDLALMLLRGVNGVMIVLSVLEFCVSTSSLVMGIKALCSSEKREDKSPDDPELYKPLLEEVTSNPTV